MENQTHEESKTIYIELELVVDIYSLIFWCVRFHLELNHQIQIDNKEVSILYGKSLHKGIKDLLTNQSGGFKNDKDVEAEISKIIDSVKTYGKTLKPMVPNVHVLKTLEKDENLSIEFFSYLESDTLSTVINEGYLALASKTRSIDELIESTDTFTSKSNIIIFGCSIYFTELDKLAKDKEATLLHVRHAKDEVSKVELNSHATLDSIKFEDYSLPKFSHWYDDSLKKVELHRELKTSELPFWESTLPIEKTQLQGKVVNGFKRGSKELGVPTANLALTAEFVKKLEFLFPGVYCGTVQFSTYENNEKELKDKYGDDFKSKLLPTAISIGWNPSYDNNQRTVESYILDEFENDFYGEELKVEITHYIRAESNYTTLDHLIMAIHNDIETTKKMVGVGWVN